MDAEVRKYLPLPHLELISQCIVSPASIADYS
jgi:hypothetical protein